MLLLYTKDTHNFFAVDNATGTMNYVSGSAFATLRRFEHYLGGIDILTFRTKEDIDKFRKVIKKTPLTDVPLDQTRDYLMTHFPEYFI